MPMYMGFDGGGSSSRAILFDENGPIGYGQSGGMNANFMSREESQRNMGDALGQALQGAANPVIETMYAVVVGPGGIREDDLRAQAQARARVKEFRFLSEGDAGLYAGALRLSGMVALSGTGSDSFYTRRDGTSIMLGGFGSILGDDGSGFWIAHQAMRKAIAYGEGWGEPTDFLELIKEKWELSEHRGLVRAVLDTPAPYRRVASALPVVAEAARGGDGVCLELFRQAGRLMAAQTLALIQNEQPPAQDRLCVCCGGAWKAHPAMYEVFIREMGESAPDVQVQKPVFEPWMASVVIQKMRAEPDLGPQELASALMQGYAQYRAVW